MRSQNRRTEFGRIRKCEFHMVFFRPRQQIHLCLRVRRRLVLLILFLALRATLARLCRTLYLLGCLFSRFTSLEKEDFLKRKL